VPEPFFQVTLHPGLPDADNLTVRRRITATILVLLASALSLYGQETNPEKVPGGYRDFVLGSDMEQVKRILESDPWFYWRGEPEVSLQSEPNRNLIDCDGSGFIKRGYFQFDNDRLFVITLEINPRMVDYFTLFTRFRSRYGEPAGMDPDRAWWESEGTRLILEKPLTVKYLDRKIFREIVESSDESVTARERLRREFLDAF
jgi:hypothetical protein